MKRILLSLALTGACALAQADIVVEDAYVRAPPPGGAAGSAYMKLRNTADAEVALVGAASNAAGKVTLHDTMDHGDMLHMMSISSLNVPAKGELLLKSGGAHLMLEELSAELVPGSEVELSLQFSDGSTVSLQAPVRSVLDE